MPLYKGFASHKFLDIQMITYLHSRNSRGLVQNAYEVTGLFSEELMEASPMLTPVEKISRSFYFAILITKCVLRPHGFTASDT